MSNSAQNRRRAVLLPLGLLMLSMAVFGWGLQYKLSLYQSKNSIAHLAPEAKLLSQKERPAAVQAPSQLSVPVEPMVLMLASIFSLTQVTARYLRAQNLDDGWPPLPACYRVVSVRPPPATAFSL